MKKSEFLEELNEYLVGIPKSDKEEILQDYEEHFKVGKKKKRSDAEIIKSLGDPKKIARDVRNELSSSEQFELKSEAIETWVALKKFSKNIFNEARDKIDDTFQKEKKSDFSKWILISLIFIIAIIILNSPFLRFVGVVVLVYIIYKYFEEDGKNNKRKTKVKTKSQTKTSIKEIEENDSFKVVICVLFNVLFFVWFWFSLFWGVVSFFITSLAILISGIAVIVFAIFALISQNNPIIKDIILSGLFAGLGLVTLGSLFMAFSQWIIKIFFKLSKFYIELNRRFIKK
jgi:uncharacterized membrane protein